MSGMIRETAGDGSESLEAIMIQPPNFNMVELGVYRSGFPQPANFAYLRTLRLRSIIYLCMEPYPEEQMSFLNNTNIKLFQFGIKGKTEAAVSIPQGTLLNALITLLDERNHPVLIHCNGGKHRTGCLVGCFRKLLNWRLESVLEEYQRFAGAKSRKSDVDFIGSFDVMSLRHSLYNIIYSYQCFVSNKRSLISLYDGTVPKPRIISNWN